MESDIVTEAYFDVLVSAGVQKLSIGLRIKLDPVIHIRHNFQAPIFDCIFVVVLWITGRGVKTSGSGLKDNSANHVTNGFRGAQTKNT